MPPRGRGGNIAPLGCGDHFLPQKNISMNSTGCRMLPIRRINELRHSRGAPIWQRNYAVSPNTGVSPTVGATHASPLQRSAGPLKRSLGGIVGSYKRVTVTGPTLSRKKHRSGLLREPFSAPNNSVVNSTGCRMLHISGLAWSGGGCRLAPPGVARAARNPGSGAPWERGCPIHLRHSRASGNPQAGIQASWERGRPARFVDSRAFGPLRSRRPCPARTRRSREMRRFREDAR